jgi:hypothetical protein
MESAEASVDPFPLQAVSKNVNDRIQNKIFMNVLASRRCVLPSHALAESAVAVAVAITVSAAATTA